jgi:hypothetical protein
MSGEAVERPTWELKARVYSALSSVRRENRERGEAALETLVARAEQAEAREQALRVRVKSVRDRLMGSTPEVSWAEKELSDALAATPEPHADRK